MPNWTGSRTVWLFAFIVTWNQNWEFFFAFDMQRIKCRKYGFSENRKNLNSLIVCWKWRNKSTKWKNGTYMVVSLIFWCIWTVICISWLFLIYFQSNIDITLLELAWFAWSDLRWKQEIESQPILRLKKISNVICIDLNLTIEWIHLFLSMQLKKCFLFFRVFATNLWHFISHIMFVNNTTPEILTVSICLSVEKRNTLWKIAHFDW